MTGTWRGGIVESSAAGEPPAATEWYEVSVPGRAERFAGESAPIVYERRFPDPRREDGDRALLTLLDVLGRVRVWLNGTQLAAVDRPVGPVSVPFDPEPENLLRIVCEPNATVEALAQQGTVPATDLVPGIRGSVTVSRRPSTVLTGLSVTPTVTDDGATLDVTVDVDAAEPVDDVLNFSLRPDGFRGGGSMDRTPIEADAGDRLSIRKAIEVRDPSLWWPRELGPQHRYTLRVKLGEQSLERTVGLCDVDRDADGFLVNGRRVAARGLTVRPGAADADAVAAAVDANATVLRLPAFLAPASFYEACDESGVLVWQGLPEPTPIDADRATETVRTVVDRFGHHPSLAALTVADRGMEDLTAPLGTGTLSKLRLRYRAWRRDADRGGADAVAAEIPDGVASVPTIGPPGADADALSAWPGWAYLDASAAEWLLTKYSPRGRVLAGFGAATDVESDDPTFPGAAAVGTSRDLPDEDADGYQRHVLKTVAEAARYRGYGGVVADTLVDAGNGDAGICRADRSRKSAFDALAASFEPIQAVTVGPPAAGGSVQLAICNDTPDAVETTVSWTAGDRSGSAGASVDPHAVTDVESISIPSDASTLELVVETDDRIVNRYDL
ncbi:glycoside hydrolase [Halovivax limisalsi]|uniref:glycoside hydrolase n=1 Tax=Halovivax limisalsi TaxID=1453760 RepID=UPI001FFDCA35|nr:glycoside hydrolase [Halovivax limisalsi]